MLQRHGAESSARVQVKDEEGKLMNDFSGRTKPNEVSAPEGFKRTITVALDTAQYQLDMDTMQESKGGDVYAGFNVLMRRKPKVWLPNKGHITHLGLRASP